MDEREITLRDEKSSTGSWSLIARIEDNGGLIIEGQDLGKSVEEFWGSTEYEWDITVSAENLPRLVSALGGAIGDDPLALLAARFAQDEHYGTTRFLEDHDIPYGFWSRVGD